MRQLVLGFASERDAASAVPFDPAIQEQLVTLMAAAILAVVGDVRAEEHGGSDDADAIERQDRTTAPEAEGGGLRAAVDGPAGP